ncbi:sulfotransferase family cytosolic 1B member 1 isoform X2 [Orussus abietinus]|uniref:sulfotransferase family cytosolic 1B member 1 isoform X2 n=1 Tax=Orussus abietinus TaxID=222816 RepID=UPI0006266434|nr:sulfotransferase family cytosolic 1B member 1 isoform X2 [Orussus abietinus]
MTPLVDVTETDLDKMLRDTFTNDFRTGYITAKGYCLPEYYKTFSESIEHMEVRDDDVWVCSFPKTGTTWTQEMVWCIANDLDFEAARRVLYERFPFLETPGLHLREHVLDSVKYVEDLPSPRFVKTHLPFELLPRQIRTGEKRPKIIYVARNAKDTCISYFHHCKLLEGYRGTFEDFCALFLGKKLCYAPFFDHLLGFWKRRDDRNSLFLKYEDMKSDLPGVIGKTAEFLGKNLTQDQAKVLADHLSFASMKANPSVNYQEVVEVNKKFKLIETEGQFMRSGKVDQWKETMTSDAIDRFDEWTSQNLRGTDFRF